MESPEVWILAPPPLGALGPAREAGTPREGKRVHRVEGRDGSTRVISVCAGEGGERTPVSTASRVVPESLAWSGEPPASCPGSPYPAQVANQLISLCDPHHTPPLSSLVLTL